MLRQPAEVGCGWAAPTPHTMLQGRDGKLHVACLHRSCALACFRCPTRLPQCCSCRPWESCYLLCAPSAASQVWLKLDPFLPLCPLLRPAERVDFIAEHVAMRAGRAVYLVEVRERAAEAEAARRRALLEAEAARQARLHRQQEEQAAAREAAELADRWGLARGTAGGALLGLPNRCEAPMTYCFVLNAVHVAEG